MNSHKLFIVMERWICRISWCLGFTKAVWKDFLRVHPDADSKRTNQIKRIFHSFVSESLDYRLFRGQNAFCYCLRQLHCCASITRLVINKLQAQQMIFLQCCVWYLKNMPRDWIQLIFYRREEANKRSGCCEKKRELAPHNERAENDKWIGKLHFYYMKNHLYCAINARSEYEKLYEIEKWPKVKKTWNN